MFHVRSLWQRPSDCKRSLCFILAAALLGGAYAPPALADEPAAEGPLRWWRGNTHTHSLWSDGNEFPEMIADWYREHGYQFLVLSDHNILSQGEKWVAHTTLAERGAGDALQKYRQRFGDDWVETRGTPDADDFAIRLKALQEFRPLVEKPGEFLLIQGEEISDRAEGVPVHLNAANIEELIPPPGGRTVAEAIDNSLRAAEEQSKRLGREILVHLNHPNFGYAVTAEEIATVLRERFIEVYNGHPGVNHLGDEHHASVEQIWDVANTIRLGQLDAAPLFGVATDDSHHYHGKQGSRPGRGWIMVRAAELTPDAIIAAIKRGDLYASSGVTLQSVDYDPDSKRLELHIEPDDGATYSTQFIGTKLGYDAESQPRVDDQGKPRRTTRIYSEDVGQTLATVEGTSPAFQLTGDELYVRAVVTSSLPHRDGSFEGQLQQAWTQPVGWEARLKAEPSQPSAAAGENAR